VAQRARISKRNLYHRFPDKAALFSAVVRRFIEGCGRRPGHPYMRAAAWKSPAALGAADGLRGVLMPTALSLNRLMVVEAQRFPERAAIVGRGGGRAEVVGQIARILERVARAGGLAIDRPAFAAEQFIQLVVSLPQRRALGLGTAMTEAELDSWADDCVKLLLNGCRFWQKRAPRSETG
jgi:TetR/AcrR family transcriptional regulator, mexJK operon transcriptional repressor